MEFGRFSTNIHDQKSTPIHIVTRKNAMQDNNTASLTFHVQNFSNEPEKKVLLDFPFVIIYLGLSILDVFLKIGEKQTYKIMNIFSKIKHVFIILQSISPSYFVNDF